MICSKLQRVQDPGLQTSDLHKERSCAAKASQYEQDCQCWVPAFSYGALKGLQPQSLQQIPANSALLCKPCTLSGTVKYLGHFHLDPRDLIKGKNLIRPPVVRLHQVTNIARLPQNPAPPRLTSDGICKGGLRCLTTRQKLHCLVEALGQAAR